MATKKEPKKEIQVHQDDYRRLVCPVGKETLAYRNPWEFVEIYCRDCNHTYVFEQYNSAPIRNYRKTKEDRECGCAACLELE